MVKLSWYLSLLVALFLPCGALGQGNINVIAIAQGSSECSVSLVVAAEDAVSAVQQIHKEALLAILDSQGGRGES